MERTLMNEEHGVPDKEALWRGCYVHPEGTVTGHAQRAIFERDGGARESRCGEVLRLHDWRGCASCRARPRL